MENENIFLVIKAAVVGIVGAFTAAFGWLGWLVLAWVFCMIIDYITGSWAAMAAGDWSSAEARAGIWHKGGMVAIVVVSALADGVLGAVINDSGLPMPMEYTVLLCPVVLMWYILTELGSIVENAGALGAPIPGWLAAAIQVLGSSVDKAGEAVTGDKDDNE